MPKTPAEKKPRGRLVVLLVLLVIVVAAGAVLGVKNLGSSGNTSTSTTSAPLSGVGSSHFCADFKSLLSMHSGAQSLTQGKASAAEANTLLGRLQNEPPSSLHYDVAYVARALIPLERAYLDLGTNPSSSQIQQLAPLSDRAFAALSSPQFQHVYSWAKANCPASERPPLSIGTGGPSGT
jgi:hypothetical protein